ncbi:MAG: MBL fold metallo-hydrolase [Mariprofundaceae bacterium]|nr:MBL fold metallo-hydrolase [Mariprofundaceae bacterium]
MSMFFQQLFDEETCTYTYVLADDKKEALLIDPVLECIDQYTACLDTHQLQLKYVLDTHIHADHITAADALRQRTGCQTAISSHAAVTCADIELSDGMRLICGGLEVHVLETPGHTPTCLSFLCENMVFTGDALLIDGCGRTDFQGGDAGVLYESITQKLFVLPASTRVYPGHDYHGKLNSTIGAEKQHNPRLQHTKLEFIALMDQLNLPNPKRMHEAVPANQACGKI